MANFWVMQVAVVAALCVETYGAFVHMSLQDLTKCAYGERGSLTATCVNATPQLFKSTLYKFDHLDETLLCVNCTLTSIESNTFDISGNQIHNLDISKSKIESLKPKAFMGLIFLENLNMSYNKIRSVYPGTFNGTKKITTIDLSNNEISILSENGFTELVNLKTLKLDFNVIKTIDDRAFVGLTNIQELDLSHNQIETIENQIVNLTTIEILKLNDNKLATVDRWEFYNLTKLRLLDLSNNVLITPAFVMDATNQLREIQLGGNRIDAFWFPLERLYALEKLVLSHNNISGIAYIPANAFPNLRVLDLSYNHIDLIQTGKFTGFPQLNELNFSHNSIQKIEVTGVMSLMSLHTLDLSNNNITDLDYNLLISRMPSLSYMKLLNNLLPCDLEQAMEDDFREDNFKFVLFENRVGSMKCIEKPLAEYKSVAEAYIHEESSSVSASNVVILVLLTLVIIAIAFLFYVQYKFYKGESFTLHVRAESNMQLVNQHGDLKDDDTN